MAKHDRTLLLYVGLWLLAFSLRAIYLLEIRHSPLFHVVMGDAWKFDTWAQELAAGDWLGRKVFFISPIYAYGLGALYALFGHSLTLVRWVQAALGAASCVLLASAGRKFLGSRAGMLAGLLLAITPTAIFYDGLIQKSVLDLLFLCLLLFFAGRAQERPGRARWLATGAAYGLFSLSRENGLALFPLLCAWIWFRFRPRPALQRLRWMALLAAGAALVLSPVTLRNLWLGGELHLTSSQYGFAFYMGNNKEANGTYTPLRWGRGNIQHEEQDSVEIPEKELGRSLSPAEVSRYWMGKALADIRRAPARWLGLLGRKWLLTWNANEIGDVEDLYSYADSSLLLRGLNVLFHFGVLCPLAVFGMALTWERRRELWLLYLLLLGYSATVALFSVSGRYRFPLVPVLLLFAAGGLSKARALLRGGNRWDLGAAGLAALAVALPVNTAMTARNAFPSNTHYNLGTLLMDQGKLPEALAEMQEAVRLDPGAPSARNSLGFILAGLGRREEALASFQEALRLKPDYAGAHYNLGVTYSEEGNAAKALHHFRESVRLDPDQPLAHYNLGSILYQQGNVEETLTEFSRAAALDPNMAEARQGMAVALVRQGKIEEGIAQFREIIRLRPDDKETHYKIGLLLRSKGRNEEAAVEFAAAGKTPPAAPAPTPALAPAQTTAPAD